MFDHQSSIKKYDALVVGAGISGLTTALILSKEGKRVALFERDRDIAPLIRPYKRKGCECSPGLHISGWMGDGDVIASFFKYLNVFDGVESELNPKGFGNIIIGSNKYHFPRGYDNVTKSLLAYFPESNEAVYNYMRLIKEVNEETFFLNHKLAPELNNSIRFAGSKYYQYTLEACLKQYHASQRLIDVLGMFNYILMGSKADEVPFIVHAFVLGGFYQSPGIFTINGIKRLLSNFKRELSRFGVELLVGSDVDEIIIDNYRNAVGVKTTSGAKYFSSNIIASFNPKLLMRKVKQNVIRPVYRQRLDEAENTFGLHVAFYQIEDCQDIEFDNFIYYNDKLDIALGATVNHSGVNKLISIFLTDDYQIDTDNSEGRSNRALKKLELIEKILYQEIPGLQGKLVLLDFLKPWSFERYTKTVNGSAYGIKQTVSSMGFQHRVPIGGLYLVGQAIYPGFLGSMLSGFSLAFQMLESNEFWSKVTNQ